MRNSDKYLLAVTLVVGMAFPWFGASDYHLYLAFTLAIYIVLGESWLLSSGFTGYYSFGHAAFFGIGGYALAIAVKHLVLLPWFLAAGLGAGVGAAASIVLAAVLGWVTLRVHAVFFSLLTLMLLFLMTGLALKGTPLTGGSSGILVPLIQLEPHQLALAWYYFAFGLAIVAALVTMLVQRSGLYVRVIAIRDDEAVAEAAGVPTLRLKILHFCMGAALASLAGSANFYHAQYVDPTIGFSILITAYALLMPVFGGVTSWFGPVVGSFVLQLVSYFLGTIGASELNTVVFGLVLMGSMLFFRDGLIGLATRTARRVGHQQRTVAVGDNP